MVTSEVVDCAGRLLADAAPAKSKVILFGSRSRDDATAESDFDFLVIEPSVQSKGAEMVRLRAALDPLRVAADVVVVTRASTRRHAAACPGRSSTTRSERAVSSPKPDLCDLATRFSRKSRSDEIAFQRVPRLEMHRT